MNTLLKFKWLQWIYFSCINKIQILNSFNFFIYFHVKLNFFYVLSCAHMKTAGNLPINKVVF